MPDATTSTRNIIRKKQVRALTGLSDSETYRKAKDPSDPFPAPLQLGPSMLGWYEDEVLAWRNARPRVVEKTAAA